MWGGGSLRLCNLSWCAARLAKLGQISQVLVLAGMKTQFYHYVFDLIILLSDSLMTEHKMIFRNYNTSVHLVPSLKIRGLRFESCLGLYQSEVLQLALAR